MPSIPISQVPRVDRAAVMARAEAITSRSPGLTFSDALWQAAQDYENGLMGTIPLEDQLMRAARDHPDTLMKSTPSHPTGDHNG